MTVNKNLNYYITTDTCIHIHVLSTTCYNTYVCTCYLLTCVCVCACLCVVHAGGHDGDGLLDTVERYDPDRDTWTVITTLSVPRCLGSLVALKGCLYAIGGYDGASVLQCFQVCIFWLILCLLIYDCMFHLGGGSTLSLYPPPSLIWIHHGACNSSSYSIQNFNLF